MNIVIEIKNIFSTLNSNSAFINELLTRIVKQNKAHV